ncbi:MAG: type II toxin-antitoxin system VapC family toxin [Candidatus Omnitrophica bacterium]|nr:type II toxin-antitoxin system VapC family toxin [Candidatus Omnitrophota bacterium]
MNLLDVNVLVYAFRRDSERHEDYRRWLLEQMGGTSAFGISEQVLSSLIRITTHPRIFRNPSRAAEAVAFAERLRAHPACRIVSPSPTHWGLFARLCEKIGAKGNLVADAWFAALALDSGCTWITADRDYARFPGLRWRHPLDHEADIQNPR